VVPTINAAATAAGRPTPASCAAADLGDERRRRHQDTVNERLAIYGTLPSYRAMLDREGADGPATSVSSAPASRSWKTARTRRGRGHGVLGLDAGGADDRDETYDTLSNSGDLARVR